MTERAAITASPARKHPRYGLRVLLLAGCLLGVLCFALFQGGKLAYLLLIVSASVACYLLLGKYSGIDKVKGERMIGLPDSGSGQLAAGESVAIEIRVQVPGIWPIPYILVKDQLRRRGGEPQSYETSIVLDWKRSGSVSYRTAPLRRGFYQFGETVCATEDVFGFFEHKGQLDAGGSFSVYPRTIAIKSWPQLHRMLKGFHHHSATTRAVRETTQLNGVREYNYGDRLSRIHWHATARTGTLKSKEFERESLPKTLVILDRELRRYATPEQFELAVSTTASLCGYASKQELAFGLLSGGEQAAFLEPRQGLGQHRLVMNHLVEAECDGRHPLEQVLLSYGDRMALGSFVAVVSPRTDAKMLEAVEWLHLRQMNVAVFTILSGQAKPDAWFQQLKSKMTQGYGVRSLAELPDALGGML